MKKIATITGSAALIVISAASLALAQTMPPAPTSPSVSAPPMTVQIGRDGRIVLRGVVASISGNTVNVSSWAGSWPVDASQATIVRKYGGKASLSELQSGDAVQVWGTASQSGLAVAATKIKDNSIEERYPVYGIISNLNASNQSFTLTNEKGVAFTVTLQPNAKIYVNRGAAQFADLVSGMRARVKGVVDRTSLTVSATIVWASTVSTQSGTNSSSTSH